MDTDSTLARRLRIAYLALSLTYLAAVMWTVLVPQHKRTEWKLRLLRSSTQVTSRLARRTGAASMAHELQTGRQEYGLPYRLSLARDAAAQAYQRARDVTA